MNYDFGFGYDIAGKGSYVDMNTQAASIGPKQAQQGPSMVEQLQARRQALLVELRDTEQALESLAAHPEFEQIMPRVLRAHRY